MRGNARSVAAALGVLAALPAAALAAFPQTAPNDPLFDASPLPNSTAEQWDLQSPGGGFDRGISADRAWRLSTGRGALIADIDVGVQLDHPDLRGAWAENEGEIAGNGADDDRNGYVDDRSGWDFYARDPDPTSETRNAHGTNVAGVLAARTDNGIGIAGIAPDARVLPVRTADNIIHQGVRLAQGIVYAADRGADSISMSLGADSFTGSLRRAVRYANRRGAVMAVAIGNEFHFHQHYPQVMEDVLAVAGINPDTANLAARHNEAAILGTNFKVRASYSDYGPHVDVAAPTQVPTTEWGGGYRKNWDGTSAAAPHVGGTAALVASLGRERGLRLSADEVMQIIRMSADDLADRSQGYATGWDRFSGYGRVNAYEALLRTEEGRIPPVAKLTAPDWFEPIAGGRPIVVRGVVRGRSATSWRLELGRGEQPREWRIIARGRGSARTVSQRLAVLDVRRLEAGGWTLRLRATDSNANTGEGRRFFTVQARRGLKARFPIDLGTSGEASPQLADLNRDGRDEIVLATSDGEVQVRSGRTGRMLRGWPRQMHSTDGARPSARRIGRVRSGFLATPAIGDISGTRGAEVVAAGLDGRIYAWTSRGRRVRGFPRRIPALAAADYDRLDRAIYASPALADLNADRKLDIVFGAADQRVYAIDGRGRPLAGWPVLARDGDDRAKILSSPAVGDLDGDGSPEIVEGTAEAYGSTPDTSGRVYAWNARGERIPGWPVRPPALAADSIPLAGEGVPVSPSLADVDGDGRDEVAVAAFTGQPELYRGDGTRMGGKLPMGNHFETLGRGDGSAADAPSILALGANGAFGQLEPGGPLRFFGGVVDSRLALAQQLPATRTPFEHLLGGWDARTGRWLRGFPKVMEGWTIAAGPAIADVDGDGRAEVLAGSSGNALHAFDARGGEPEGWPKRTGNWLLAAPAAGDIDGDGRTEIVAVSRDGYLFAWDTAGRAADVQWSSLRGGVENRGRPQP